MSITKVTIKVRAVAPNKRHLVPITTRTATVKVGWDSDQALKYRSLVGPWTSGAYLGKVGGKIPTYNPIKVRGILRAAPAPDSVS